MARDRAKLEPEPTGTKATRQRGLHDGSSISIAMAPTPPSKFLILGSGRSGSNLLVSMLNSHPEVRCHGELFHTKDRDQIYWIGRSASREEFALRASDPQRFIDDSVYRAEPHIRAIGFKLFYYHARQPEWTAVWGHLASMQNLRVIHLQRINQLRRLVSDQLAKLTSTWTIQSNQQAHPKSLTIELTPKTVERRLAECRAQARNAAALFAEREILDLSYEELAARPNDLGARILDFLGLPPAALTTKTRKQTVRPLSSVLRNYHELERHFQATEWASMFDD